MTDCLAPATRHWPFGYDGTGNAVTIGAQPPHLAAHGSRYGCNVTGVPNALHPLFAMPGRLQNGR